MTLSKAGGYELEKTYICDYWREVFKVIEVHGSGESYSNGWAVTVIWADGRKTTHSTPRTSKDIELPVDIDLLDTRGRIKSFDIISKTSNIPIEKWQEATDIIKKIIR